MTASTAEIVICGAGIAGIAAAYHLAVKQGMHDIVLVEQGAPLTLTSDKSTEAYRNWWPGPGNAMVALMNRSIDLLEGIAHETDNRIQLNRRGYVYATADPDRVPMMRQIAAEAATFGAGPLRIHETGHSTYCPAPAHGFSNQPDGADLLLDPQLIRAHFPYITEQTLAVLHARRCGWFSAQQLGMYMLEQARAHGVQLIHGQITNVDTHGGRVRGVDIAQTNATQTVSAPRFVNAAGPMQKAIGNLLGIDIPVFAERHVKMAFNDHLGIVARDAPMLIWTDDIVLPWSDEEREAFTEDSEMRWLLDRFPAGVHCRPEGHGTSSSVLILWNRHLDPVEPTFPITVEEHYAELALRGMAVMIPPLARYFDRAPKPYIDGGYYMKTRENRPLIGPLPVDGAYMVGALSGFGVMAACAAGELLAAHVSGSILPAYAPDFALARYNDPAYQQRLANWGDVGQL